MIDFSLQSGTCSKYLDNLCTEKAVHDPDIIKNYPYFNYLLRSGTPNNFKYGKFGILLTIFLGIIKKLDASLIRYFDAFFYQLMKELDFTPDGLTIPRVETVGLKSFFKILSEVTGNNDIRLLGNHLNVSLNVEQDPDLEDILGDVEMLLCHVIIKYNVERILSRLSVVPGINIFEINKILFIKYFPRTLMLLKYPEVIPSGFLFNSPLRMYYYGKSLLKKNKDNEAGRILELELKIFKTKFFIQKDFYEFCDLDLMYEKINNRRCKSTIRVNDTISILRNYYSTDIDLEHWTGTKFEDKREIIDVMVYYDYMNRKVRHQAYTNEIKEILLFYWPLPHNKFDYLKVRTDKTASESLLNELIYKNILV